MNRLDFDYQMQIDYSEVVSSCHFTIKCIPQNTLRQRTEDISIALSPDVSYSAGTDSFGNSQIYGWDDVDHTTFSFRIRGCVYADSAGREETVNDDMLAVFRHPHGLNRAGEALAAYHKKLTGGLPEDPYEKGFFLMQRLHRDFRYEKGCTDMNTTAEQAWQQGRGVCQDYAHILIALLHREHIPARYVTGMLLGEGASHAWVELAREGHWYGLDPTGGVPVGEEHIRIGVGRDAGDCLINRGIMHGGGMQRQSVRVSVIKKDAQSG